MKWRKVEYVLLSCTILLTSIIISSSATASFDQTCGTIDSNDFSESIEKYGAKKEDGQYNLGGIVIDIADVQKYCRYERRLLKEFQIDAVIARISREIYYEVDVYKFDTPAQFEEYLQAWRETFRFHMSKNIQEYSVYAQEDVVFLVMMFDYEVKQFEEY